jgi:hypothetical protein
MSAQAFKRRARFAGAILALSLSATHAFAEPPRHDAPKMRNAPRASAVLTTLSQPEPAAQEPKAAQPSPAQPAAAAVDPAKVDRAAKEATATLELCYHLARRSDPSLKAPVELHATVRADGAVELRAHAQSLGDGFFSRCVERKLSAIRTVAQAPEATAATRTIVLGAAPVAIVR